MSSIQFDSGFGSVLEMVSVAGGLANNTVTIGENCSGISIRSNEDVIVGSDFFNDWGLPPFPIKISVGTSITDWAVSFEATASVGIDLSQLDPAGLLGLKAPEVHAELFHAPRIAGSPIDMSQLVYTKLDDLNLGEIPTVGAGQAYTGGVIKGTPIAIASGDYLAVRFYINSELASSVTGFHAQAIVNIN